MTTPLLDAEDTQLDWQKKDQRRASLAGQQTAQDTIVPDAARLTNDSFYNRLSLIQNSTATATAGSIAGDNTRRQREDAERSAQFERDRQAALQASTDAFGQWSSGYAGNNGVDSGSVWGGGGAQGVANVLRAAGFSEDMVPTMMAIARAESSWNPAAVNSKNANGTTDNGLFQINSVHKGNSWYPTDLNDPLQSAKAAFAIYQSQGLNAWTVYKTNKYKDFLQAAPAVQPFVSNTGGNTGLRNAQVSQAQVYSGVPTAYNNGNYGPQNNKGLAGNAIAARDFITKNFGITNIGGFGGGSVAGSDHPHGKALDVMIGNYKSTAGINQGTSVANWFIQNPKAFGVKYIIWRDRIWQNGVWKPYSHPSGNNDTLQHRDHVHISFL